VSKNGDDQDGGVCTSDQVLGLRKEEREKQKAKGKGINSRSHFVLVIKTLSECDHI
jgi:hypothetical protein